MEILSKDIRSECRVLVTGVGGPAGRNTVRYLRQQGVNVAGTDMRQVETDVDQFYTVPAANTPGFVSALQHVVEESGVSLLIPTVSEELPIMAQHKTMFVQQGCHVVIAPHAAVEIANDKFLTAQFLAQRNISVPDTLDSGLRFEVVGAALGYPLIAKPRVSRGGRGVVIHHDASELAQEQRQDIVYQQFLNGQEYDVNLYIDTGGIVKACVTLLKTQLRDGLVGNAAAVERADNPAVADLARQACLAIGITGPVDVDIRLDASGKPKLLEINARIGANVLFAQELLENLLAEWQVPINP